MDNGDIIREVFKKYATGPEGLTKDKIAARRAEYGPNMIVPKKKKPLILSFLEEFKDLLVIILIIAALLAFIGGESRDGMIILFIVVLNASIGFTQRFKAERAIEALKRLVAPKARVIREGKEVEIEARELVPGDVLVLREGDSVTADSVLFEVNELEVQESALTGESMPVQKLTYDIEETKDTAADKENMVFMGTAVTHGNGMAVVAFTGMRTEMGKIARLTTETKKALSPLEKELFRIGLFVGKIAFVISAVLLAVGIFVQEKQFVETLLFATSVAVAAVPEGLPATITIALAIGVQRLARKKAIVKQLSSAETLGSTTVICSDKTGTLTKNEMTVKEVYLDKHEISIHGVGYEPAGSVHIEHSGKPCVTIGSSLRHYDDYEKQRKALKTLPSTHPELYFSLEKMMLAAGLCNDARLEREEGAWKIFGDPTEGALLTMVEKVGFDLDEMKRHYTKVSEITFDSTRKRMTVIVRDSKSGALYAFTKGSPDGILEVCDRMILNGKTLKMDPESKDGFRQKSDAMAEKALRGLGFAYRELTAKEAEELDNNGRLPKDTVEKNLVFLGLCGMIDPPRPEVRRAVDMAHSAGIRTYIITGDHGLTAEAIARQLNLIGLRKHIIITGETLNNLSDQSLSAKLKDRNLDIIFARVSPEHKLRIVDLLEKQGEIVAVTGDGVNDAPALKRADIGIAMGITGTDVSKEAADMVLTDDSYSTIVTAIREGRTIYDNLRKFVFFIFSCNFAEVLTVFTAILMGLPAPLTAVLILVINLGTDVLPAVALGIEPPEPGTMNRKPRDPKSKIMDKPFISRFVYIGMLMGIIVMVVYIWTLYRYGWSWGMPLPADSLIYLKASSTAFVQLIIIQMVNAYNAKSEFHSVFRLGFLSNPYLLGSIAISVAMTVALVEIPLIQEYLGTTGLNLVDWSIIIGSSLLILAVEEVRKIFVRRRMKFAVAASTAASTATSTSANPKI